MIIKTKINSQTIANLNDKELDELVYNKAVDLYLKTFGEYFKDTEQDRLLLQILSISILDSEIYNGGFDQFFLNSGNLSEAALKGLSIISAEEHAQLLTLAIKINKEQYEEFKNERNPNLDELDEKYFQLEDLGILRQKFIKENIERFYD
jgi:hypothetical protein